MKKINLELTKDQFLELMRLTFIWEMVINWHKTENFDKDSQKFKDFIIKQAIRNNIKDYLCYYKWSKEYDYGNDYDMEFYSLLSDYCDESFHEDLVEILSKNIMFDKFSEEKIEEMWENEYEEKKFKFIDKISNEFEKNDYDNITIINKNPLFKY